MDFPFGHHDHRRNDDDHDDDLRRRNHPGFHPPPGVRHVCHDRGYEPPLTYADGSVNHVTHDRGYDTTPPFSENPVQHISHDSRPGYAPPPPFFRNSVHHVSHDSGSGYSPPPFFSASVVSPQRPSLGESLGQHVAHESQYGIEGSSYGREEEFYDRRPGYSEMVTEESSEGGAINTRGTVRIFTKADENYSLSIMDGKVILTRTDRSDERQHWIKDLKYSTKIKDEEGFPAFALVNKATGEALKHSFGATHPVRLVPYNPNYPDESVLWSESKDLGDGFRCIRMVNNIRLNFDAFHGDANHGGVHDGTILVLWEWLKGNNQRWKIVLY